jgi:hypothetical protein
MRNPIPGLRRRPRRPALRVAAIFAALALAPANHPATCEPPAPASVAASADHPLLFFNKKTLPALQQKLTKAPFAARWSRLLECAGEFCAAPVAGFEKVRDAQGICEVTAFAYALTGQAKFAERARKEALALLAAPAWHESKDWNKGAELPTAEASEACALVYDWCFDALTAAEKKSFRDGLLARSTQLYLKSVEEYKDWWVDDHVTNWCGVVHGGCGLAALALADEGTEFKRAAELARSHVAAFLHDVTLEDGGGFEGVMYHRYGLAFAHAFLAADLFAGGAKPAAKPPARSAAPTDVLDDETRKLAGYWDVYMQGPDQKYANFGDMNEGTCEGLYGRDPRQIEGGPSAALCALFEAQVPGGDPLLLWAADNGGAPFFDAGPSPFWFLWRREAPPSGPRPELQEAVLFRGSGHAILQSPSLWLALNAGWTSDKSHFNLDLGTFVLVANGERFVCDPGYEKIETGDHSTLLVNGKSQPKNVRATWLAFGSGRRFHYGAVDLTDAVKGDLKRWVRQVVMVRGSYVVVADDVTGDADVEWRLQTHLKLERGGDRRSATIVGEKSSLAVVSVAPADVQIGVGTGAASFLSGRPKARHATLNFLTVLHPSAAPPTSWDGKGVLKVGGDTLTFKQQNGAWMLVSVNDETTAKLGTGKERSLVPFRKH